MTREKRKPAYLNLSCSDVGPNVRLFMYGISIRTRIGETASEDDSSILATMDPDLIERIHFKMMKQI